MIGRGEPNPLSGRRWLRALARVRRLASPTGRRLPVAWVLLLEVDVRLRLGGFARLQKLACPYPEPAEAPEPTGRQLADTEQMAAAIGWAARFFPRARCLHRSLVLLLWLRRRGHGAELRIGVRGTGDAIEAHAWVEYRGVVLGEDRSLHEDFALLE